MEAFGAVVLLGSSNRSALRRKVVWQMMEKMFEEMTVAAGMILRSRVRMAFGATVLGVLFCVAPGMGLMSTALAQGPTAKQIYPTVEASPAGVRAAIAKARSTHKRVLIDFGGDWCPDCQVLDIYANQSPNKELLAKYFVKVNVNIGHMDANLDLAHKYGVPITGVPALAVVDGYGKVIYAQTKEFSDMRNMQSSDLTDFLNKWKK